MSLSRYKKYKCKELINSEVSMSDNSQNLYISVEVASLVKHYEKRIFELEEKLENTKSDLAHISTLFIEEKEHLEETNKCLCASSRENKDLKAYIQDLHVALEKKWSQSVQNTYTYPDIQNNSQIVSSDSSETLTKKDCKYSENQNKILDCILPPFDENDERIITRGCKKYHQWRYHLMDDVYWYDEEEIPEKKKRNITNNESCNHDDRRNNSDNENENDEVEIYKKKVEGKKKAYQDYLRNDYPKWEKMNRECFEYIKKKQKDNKI